MTVPAAIDALACRVIVDVRPRPEIIDCAAVCVRATTFGTVAPLGPTEMTSAIGAPLASVVPAGGLVLMTRPAATVALAAVVTLPTTSPAAVMFEVAAPWLWL